MKKEVFEKVRRDKTFEEFLDAYKRNIEGKIDPSLRVDGRPETAPFDPNKKRTKMSEIQML